MRMYWRQTTSFPFDPNERFLVIVHDDCAVCVPVPADVAPVAEFCEDGKFEPCAEDCVEEAFAIVIKRARVCGPTAPKPVVAGVPDDTMLCLD